MSQNKQFHLLVDRNGLTDDEKKAIVSKHTFGRTEHSHEMQIEEMNSAIGELKQERYKAIRKYMPVIGLCCHRIGWVVKTAKGNEIDYAHLNNYVKSHYHRDSYAQLSNTQLDKLIISLKQIAKSKGILL